MTTTKLIRNRGLGPTQRKVLEALRSEAVSWTRAELEEITGCTIPQVRSALNGLLRRELVARARDGDHKTAPWVWWALSE